MHTSRPILIAYDGSEGAKVAIEAAGRLFPAQSTVVLSVWRSMAAAAPATLIAIPSGVAAEACRQLDLDAEQQAVALAAEGAAAATAVGLDAASVAVRSDGQVWASIVDAAQTRNAQAVVVGSRGRSAVKSALLGSVANGVVHHCSQPVVVVPGTA